MKKQKMLLVLSVGIILVPFIAQAAWWNPFSWLDNSPEEQNTDETQEAVLIQESEEVLQEKQNVPEVDQILVDTTPKIKTTEPERQVPPTIINQVVDNIEINNLKAEIKALKTTLTSIQSQNANTVTASNTKLNDSSAVYEQILNRLNEPEQKVENVENQINDNDYSKLLVRIEKLENNQPQKAEDQSGIIKNIIERVNLLSNNAGVVDSNSVGAQYWVSLVCDPGNLSTGKGGGYDDTLKCGDLADLKY